MIDIKRLHQVHKDYPFNSWRQGKTTYCFDSLLRLAQTGAFKKIAYITNNTKTARCNRNEFLIFVLQNADLDLKRVSDKLFSVEICNCEVEFFGREDFFRGVYKDVEAIVEDYY
jgi:hypothetical protein